jgi:hypothetical protein
MEIRIGNHTEYLDIKDIVPEGQELGYDSKSVEFLRGTLGLKANGVTSDIRASFMIGEIKQLGADLQRLYDSLKYEFVFTNLEGSNVEIRFTPTPNGQIEMKGYLRNEDYSVKIDFKIVTDQTFLPGIMNQIRSALTFKSD